LTDPCQIGDALADIGGNVSVGSWRLTLDDPEESLKNFKPPAVYLRTAEAAIPQGTS
jgi:hypothetical protein